MAADIVTEATTAAAVVTEEWLQCGSLLAKDERGRISRPPEATVSEIRKLAARSVAAVTILMFVGASAFAENRHSNGTRSRSGGHGGSSHRGSASAAPRHSGHDSATRSHVSERAGRGDSGRVIRRDRDHVTPRDNDRSHAPSRNYDRSTRERGSDHSAHDRNRAPARSYDQNNHDRGRSDRGTWDRNRRDDRNHGSSAGHADRSHDSNRGGSWRGDRHSSSSRGNAHRGEPYHARGRVSRVDRHGGGYRVWIAGAHYPFFIPDRYYHHDRFRVGLTINLGGYYNRGGYYDYYDGYNAGLRTSAGALRGVVESVDSRRGTFVVRNDATGSFVTVIMSRQQEDVRPGDFVEISGDWIRSGLFEAYDVYVDAGDDGRW